jgi:hydroxypyruvate isomerase
MPIHQSVSWWCFANRGISADQLLKKAKEIGYAAVELIGADLLDQVRDQGLVIAAQGGHTTIERGMNNPAEHDRIVAEIEKNLEVAVKYQIPNLIVLSGNRRDGLTEEQGAEYCAQCLQRVSKSAEDAGVNLVMELLNSKVDHKGYQCDHTDWGVSVCQMVASPRVKLLYDIYHMQIMEGDVISSIRANIQHIGHFHTAGVPGRHELDENQELYYPAIMRAIAATGYNGYVGQELIPSGDPLVALQQAFTVCDI